MPFVLKTETTTIDGLEVRTTAFPAVRQYKLLMRLIKVHGGSVPATGGAGRLLAFMDVDPDAAVLLLLDMLSNTQVQAQDGKWIELSSQARVDEVFSGRSLMDALLPAYEHAVEVNFGSFSDAGNESDVPRP